jgi:hypothetical protein
LDTAISWVAITWVAISWFAIAWMLSVVSGPINAYEESNKVDKQRCHKSAPFKN